MLYAGRSSTNWLDRLRSSKGFPVSNGINLEEFLKANPNNKDSILVKNDGNLKSNSSGMEENQVLEKENMKISKEGMNSENKKTKKKDDLFNMMGSILSELFVMGGDSGKNYEEIRGKKKSSRKQKNPKICIRTSASASIDEFVPAMSPSSADIRVSEKRNIDDHLMVDRVFEKEDDIVGYSKADVMIIDSSSSVWKSEKVVFRKGNIWKVREKKSKFRKVLGSRKKRNSDQLSESENVGKKKKKKQRVSLSPSSSNVDAIDREESIILPNEECSPNESMVACRETLRNLSQVPQKRNQFPRTSQKLAKKGSSKDDVASSRKNSIHPGTSS